TTLICLVNHDSIVSLFSFMFFFFFQAEDGIRDRNVTGVQTCALPISKNFDGVTPSATEDKQVTGEGIIIQHMLYLFSQSVEGFRSEERRVGKECRSWWSGCD